MRSWALGNLHISWLIAGWSIGVVIGVIFAFNLPPDLFSELSWLLIGLGLTFTGLFFKQRWALVLFILAGLIIGAWRADISLIGIGDYKNYIGKEVSLSGRVKEDPDIDKNDKTILRLTDIVISGNKLPGSVWLTTDRDNSILRGDIVMVQGKLSKGFGSFVASMYHVEIIEITREEPGDIAVGVRNWFADRVRKYLPSPEVDLGLGFLLGMRRALPTELLVSLQVAGLTHVIVASGYNLTILVRASRRLFVRVSKYLAILSSSLMIVGFMAMTGLSPSMSRAGLVSGLSLLAWYYGRKIHPLVLLPISAAVTLIINPYFGWNDLGWMLSFTSFAGVMILAPVLQKYFFGDKKPSGIRQIIGETLSAQLATLPIILMAFGVLSNVALLANTLVLPLVPIIMLLIFLIGIFADIPFIAEMISFPAEWILSYMVKVTHWLSSQQWAQTEVNFSWLWVVISYFVLIILTWYMIYRTGYKLRDSNVVE